MLGRSEDARAMWKARALRALMTAVLGGCALCPACASEPDTIRLLEEPDSGSGQSRCTGDSDCTADYPRCEPNEHRCVECLSASECASGTSCSTTTHTCQTRCATMADCAGIDRRICSGDGSCVECASDYDCAGTATPRCDLRGGTCVECLIATDCNPRPCFDDCLTCVSNKCVWRT